MSAPRPQFKAQAGRALRDAQLQHALTHIRSGFVENRRKALEVLPEFEVLRRAGKAIKDHTLANLDLYLERFEREVQASGGQVHWAGDAAEAREIVLRLCAEAGARTVTKGKSMIGEEIAINAALEAAGIEPVETDLGEYIIQLAGETPSHIIAPALHKTRAQIVALFRKHHAQYGLSQALESVPEIVDEARQVLRDRYFQADVGITGANFLIAETGSAVVVTNEGNGDLTATLPKTHIVLASLEKVVPTREDVNVLLRLLARSATGQAFTAYTSFFTGPRRTDDLDGPDRFHVVLVDNGRSVIAGDSDFHEVLRCIRCGACMNHCPVYNAIGGHAYGWVYPGPIGAVLTPLLIGEEQAADLPNASTLCGRCEAVCPMSIPLPGLLRKHRERQYAERIVPPRQRLALRAWAWLAQRPAFYHLSTRAGMRLLRLLARRHGRFHRLPLAGGWTANRDLPAPQGETFLAAWKRGERP
ncbi:LutB/LldF family L-lactate oxidation iron-sulfur protein [Acidihalobacter ferrooxydans]|uniref:Iron-sulfur cluster-binding protein n=1 Tax=Acidihalobacter ferrooxydans TaxID=1765967 RepID=A0A1P8UG97_9GAMM|nr:LutB/LldF family L-lactate oxidation iron-sulfur protein [Acidihalobacter ferrooxydans]APZ42791.1 iron-sulfur cluster-binding protein [Acidihalobacter ferrooxydans]